MKDYLICISFVLCSVHLSQAARLARSCQSRWNQEYSCKKDGIVRAGDRDNNFRVPNDSEKTRLLNYVDNCFRNVVKCKNSAVPSQKQGSDRLACFNQVKRSLEGKLQQCVTKCIEDFVMPQDLYDPNNDWNYQVTVIGGALKLPIRYCGGGKKKQIQQCVKGSGYDFNKKPPNKTPPYVCQVDADCWYSSGTDCQNTWEYQVLPQLCQCSQQMQQQAAVKSHQDQYTKCLKDRGMKAEKNDPVYKWIDNYLRGMCANAQNHPCRQERDAVSRRQASRSSG